MTSLKYLAAAGALVLIGAWPLGASGQAAEDPHHPAGATAQAGCPPTPAAPSPGSQTGMMGIGGQGMMGGMSMMNMMQMMMSGDAQGTLAERAVGRNPFAQDCFHWPVRRAVR